MSTVEQSPPPLPNGSNERSFGEKVKAAGQIAAKQAAKAKLLNVDLPNAYKQLGKHIYAQKSFKDELSEIYAEFDALSQQLATVKAEAASRLPSEGIAGKAKAAAATVKDAASQKSIEHKVSQTFRVLGETAFARFGESAGPKELFNAIRDLQAKQIELDRDITQLSQSKKGAIITPKRILIAGGVFIALLVLGALAGKDQPASPGGGASSSQGRMSRSDVANADVSENVIKISAQQLETEYVANEIAADERFKGKTLRVTGSVSEIKKGMLGGKYIVLETGNIAREVRCDFSDDTGLAQLRQNTLVTVEGQCDGLMMSVQMSNCKLVDN